MITGEDALFCVGQKAFIEKDGKVLVLTTPEGELDFPGGKIQRGEARVGAMSSLTRSLLIKPPRKPEM